MARRPALRWPWALALTVWAPAFAQTVVTLDARGAAAAPLAREAGAAAGDVYASFPHGEVLAFVAAERGRPHRVGRFAVLPTGAQQPFVVEPAPAADWRFEDVGRVAGTLAVRYRHDAADWSATLAVQASESAPWVDVLSTVENRSRKALEFPAVDGVAGPRDARLARDPGTRAALIGAATGATLAAWAPAGAGLLPTGNGPGAWFIGLPGADPLPNVVARAGRRLANFGRADTFWPLAPEGEWDAEQRNRKHWHRVPPGGSRTIARRYVVAPAGSAMPVALRAGVAAPLAALALPKLPPGPQQALAAKPPEYHPKPLAAAPPTPPRVPPPIAPAPLLPTRAEAPASPLPLPKALDGPTLTLAPRPPAPARPAEPLDPNALIAVPVDDAPLALPPLPPPPPPAPPR